MTDYVLRRMEAAEFDPIYVALARRHYDDETSVFYYDREIDADARAKVAGLRARTAKLFELRLAYFHGDECVAWSYSRQEPSDALYMQNSGVVPTHRRRGLYAGLVTETLRIALEMGFQEVWSRHRTTNNAVIIPKLKAGFVITGVEVSDTFGTRVRLAYYPHPVRRKLIDYRVGQAKTPR